MDNVFETLDLEKIKNRKGVLLNTECYIVTKKELAILEQAIKQLEAIDNANPSEALKKLYELENIDLYMSSAEDDEENDFISLDTSYWLFPTEQALLKAQEQEKVLEIIKEKGVDVEALKLSTNWLEYYTKVKCKTGKNTELTEEEFNLLKRWNEKCLH